MPLTSLTLISVENPQKAPDVASGAFCHAIAATCQAASSRVVREDPVAGSATMSRIRLDLSAAEPKAGANSRFPLAGIQMARTTFVRNRQRTRKGTLKMPGGPPSRGNHTPTTFYNRRGALMTSSVKDRVYAVAEQISAERRPTVSTVRAAAAAAALPEQAARLAGAYRAEASASRSFPRGHERRSRAPGRLWPGAGRRHRATGHG
jgi:hypothetical protein